MRLTRSLWLAVIVGTKAVDHPFLSGRIFQVSDEIGQKDPTLSHKRLTLSGGNFSALSQDRNCPLLKLTERLGLSTQNDPRKQR